MGMSCFGNKNEVTIIYFLNRVVFIEEPKGYFGDILAYQIPTFFIETNENAI